MHKICPIFFIFSFPLVVEQAVGGLRFIYGGSCNNKDIDKHIA